MTPEKSALAVWRERPVEFVEFLEKIAESALAQNTLKEKRGGKLLTTEEAETLRNSLETIRSSFQELDKLLLHSTEPGMASHVYWLLRRLIEGAFDIALIGGISDSAKNFFDSERSKPARSHRTNAANEDRKLIAVALREVSEEKGIPIKAGDKYIGSHFLREVNRKLTAKNVEVQSIRRLRAVAALIKSGQL